jgi:hypothetical protein
MAHDYFYGNDECAENYYNETYGGKKWQTKNNKRQ